MKEKNLEEMFEHFLPFQLEIITLTLSRVVAVDSCFTLLGTLQCGTTSREALLQNSHTLRFRAPTLNSNTHRITPYHFPCFVYDQLCRIQCFYSVFIFAGQVFYRSYVLRYTRLRSFTVKCQFNPLTPWGRIFHNEGQYYNTIQYNNFI